MRTRRLPTALLLAAFVLFAGFLAASCGGGGQPEQGGGSGENQQGEQQDGQQQTGQQQAGQQQAGQQTEQQQGGDGAAQGGVSGVKIALGTIRSVDAEARQVTLEPTAEVQGEQPLTFDITQIAMVTLDDQEVELADLQEGQSVQIKYISRGGQNRAVAVEAFTGG